tara:strand:+ start:412 stop:1140 length:729 start_codon:yes stop_codon:yes gene_type:complete
MKRIFDIFFSIIAIFIISPLLIILIILWIKNKNSPFYIANRVGQYGKNFKMIKIRTMVINADKSGIDSTSEDDKRITKTGRILRKFKLDELTQFINILKGDMSFVGPRPNIRREIDIYTNEEKKLLNLKPGLTDFASIVFSDESKILNGKTDPDIAYNQLIRPGKSKLGLFYLKKNNFLVDLVLIILTLSSIFSRRFSLRLIQSLLIKLNASNEILQIAARRKTLMPSPPPGAINIVKTRNK